MGHPLDAVLDVSAGEHRGLREVRELDGARELARLRIALVAAHRRLARRGGDVFRDRPVVPGDRTREVRRCLLHRVRHVDHEQVRDLSRARIEPGLLARLAVFLDPFLGLLRLQAERARHEDVEAVAARDREALRRETRHVDRRVRLLERLGANAQVVGAVVLSLEGDSVLRPTLLDQPDSLVEHLARPGLIHAEAGELHRLVAAAEPEVDAAVAHEIEQREVLGHADRIVERQHDDAGPEPDAARARCHRGQRDLGRRQVAVLAEVVLRRLDRVEAQILGGIHQLELLLDDLVLRPPRRILEQVQHSQSHRALPAHRRPCARE